MRKRGAEPEAAGQAVHRGPEPEGDLAEPSPCAHGGQDTTERIYRLCHLDPQGKVVREESLRAATDRAALAQIGKVINTDGLELWHGRRWVGCNQAKPAKPDKGKGSTMPNRPRREH